MTSATASIHHREPGTDGASDMRLFASVATGAKRKHGKDRGLKAGRLTARLRVQNALIVYHVYFTTHSYLTTVTCDL